MTYTPKGYSSWTEFYRTRRFREAAESWVVGIAISFLLLSLYGICGYIETAF